MRYEDSAEFTADLDAMVDHLGEALKILQKPQFADWMRATDKNYTCYGKEHFQNAQMRLMNQVALVSMDAGMFQADIFALDDPENPNGQ